MHKILIIVILLLFASFVQAQEATSFNFSFNHSALSVKDVDQSANFYKNVLGFQEIENRAKMEGIRWFSMGDGKELHLITMKENVIANRGLHIAFTTSNFDGFIGRLENLKITYSDWPGNLNKVHIRADGIKQIYFQDPNGYWIEVNSVAGSK